MLFDVSCCSARLRFSKRARASESREAIHCHGRAKLRKYIRLVTVQLKKFAASTHSSIAAHHSKIDGVQVPWKLPVTIEMSGGEVWISAVGFGMAQFFSAHLEISGFPGFEKCSRTALSRFWNSGNPYSGALQAPDVRRLFQCLQGLISTSSFRPASIVLECSKEG